MKIILVGIALGAIGCGTSQTPSSSIEQSLYDCADPGQRFTCAGPSDPGNRFVCHATGSSSNPYVKISVPLGNPAHVPGQSHGHKPADQAPGASANDAGTALDCDCEIRTCTDVCTGAADGTTCDDDDRCTADGTCSAGTCQPGAPRCANGNPVDACNAETGACDAETGACAIAPGPAGTTCGAGAQCDAGGVCAPIVVVINEAESSGGVPGDWVELYNAGATVAYVGGWRLLDNDNAHVAYVIPAGTTLAPGGYLVLDEAQFGFGLGGADSVRLFDEVGLVDSYAWTAHAVTTYGRCPNGTGAFQTTTSSTKGAVNDCSLRVALNEVESNGGVPGDWVEIFNGGPIAVDVSGWSFKDNDNTHNYVLPAGSTIGAGSYLVLDETSFGFGLGGADSARLFDSTGTLVDGYSWTAHAPSTYGRCPNGTGAFTATVSTKGAANDCGGTTPTGAPWPGANAVTVLDLLTVGNISGLVHDGTVLWAVQNGPSTLWRVPLDGSSVTSLALVYPTGGGDPDAEDVTIGGDGAFYVATERDNANGAVSRPSILRFLPGDGTATHEWNLAAVLPPLGANAGLEAITFVPDSYLASINFYNPALVSHDAGGLFFVGVETNGMIYAYALQLSGGFTQVAAFPSGDITSKALSFDAATGYLWQHCGAACGGQSRVLALGASGTVTTRKLFDRPTSMANLQNEGIAIAPCEASSRRFFWADDANTGGRALRADTIPCGTFIAP